jgi:hypothetical protein
MTIETKVTFDHSLSSVNKACDVDINSKAIREGSRDVLKTLESFTKSSESIQFLMENFDDESVRAVVIYLLLRAFTNDPIKGESK